MDIQIASYPILSKPTIDPKKIIEAHKRFDNWMDRLMFTLTAPVIVMDPGWGVPEKLRGDIKIQRMIHLMESNHDENHDWEIATEYEAMVYLQNASLVAPTNDTWFDIYMYLVKKYFDKDKNLDFLEDAPDELDQYHRQQLNMFRRWIFDRQIKVFKERKKVKK